MRRARAGVKSPLGDRDGWDRPRERRRYGVGKLRPSCIRSRAHEAPPQRDDVRQEQRDMLWHGSIGIMPRFAREYSSKTIIDPEKRVRDVSCGYDSGQIHPVLWGVSTCGIPEEYADALPSSAPGPLPASCDQQAPRQARSPRVASPQGLTLTAPHRVVDLSPAAKYKRPAWRPSPEQKGTVHQTIMASQRPSPPGDAIAAGRADARRFQTSFPDIRILSKFPQTPRN